MTITVIKPERSNVLNCVARYDELNPVTTGLPDMHLANCQRTFLSVLGFEQPKGDVQHSPLATTWLPASQANRLAMVPLLSGRVPAVASSCTPTTLPNALCPSKAAG